MDNNTPHDLQLFSFLNSVPIHHTTVEHPPLFTVADAKERGSDIPGAPTKNLFLKDDNNTFWLISAHQETTIDLRWLAKNLPAKKLRFAQPELLRNYLEVEPGSVSWFALLNDTNKAVRPILDKTLFNYELVGFHPLVNTATTLVTPEGLLQFAEALGYDYQLHDFSLSGRGA